jgi:hypothetical protein
MRTRIKLLILACFIAASSGAASAGDHEEQVRSIVEGWRARQGQVKTLTCSASVDSFFSKGYLSDAADPDKRTSKLLPEKDKTFANESCSWAIDFGSQRVKEEYQNGINLSRRLFASQALAEYFSRMRHSVVFFGSAFDDARFVAVGAFRVHLEVAQLRAGPSSSQSAQRVGKADAFHGNLLAPRRLHHDGAY